MFSFLYCLKGLWVSLLPLWIVVSVCVGGLAESAKYYMLCYSVGILLCLIMHLMLYRFVKYLYCKCLRVCGIGYYMLYGYVCVWYTPPLKDLNVFWDFLSHYGLYI